LGKLKSASEFIPKIDFAKILAMQNREFFWGVLTATFVADLATKFCVQKWLVIPRKILPFFELEFVENQNLAFGIALPRIWIILFSLVALVLLANIFVKNVRKQSKISGIAFGLIFGGALGNLGERIIFARVIDFIALPVIPNFNLADAALTIGIILLLAFYSKIFKKN